MQLLRKTLHGNKVLDPALVMLMPFFFMLFYSHGKTNGPYAEQQIASSETIHALCDIS
jgi:hypothetical protein